MDADWIDLADFGEVRRRVVEPVLTDLLRPGELADVKLVADHDWPRDPDDAWPDWMDSPFSTRPGDAPKSLFPVLRGSRDGRHTIDWRTGLLPDGCRSRRRTTGGTADGLDRRERLRRGPNARPVVDVGGTATAPSAMGLSPTLVADLAAWSAALDRDLQVVLSALEKAQQARFDAEFVGRPPGVRSVMFPQKKAAAARKRADEALAQAHLGRWSRLVAKHEPRPDDLVERLRTELGPAVHVPTPARIP